MSSLGAILTALVTPFDGEGRLNEPVARQLMEDVCRLGSDGIVVCGSTGEGATISDEEHVELFRIAKDELAGKCSVIAGAGSNDTMHAVKLTEQATEIGVDAILSITPYYNMPKRDGIIKHYQKIAAATDLPVIVYNNPARTRIDLDNDLLAELAQIDGITGVKQARTTDLALIDGLDLYAGNDDMLAPVLDMGGVGGILVASHLFGQEMKAMVEEPERRHAIDAYLADAYRALTVCANPMPIKAALRALGYDLGPCRLPLTAPEGEQLEQILRMLDDYGLYQRFDADRGETDDTVRERLAVSA